MEEIVEIVRERQQLASHRVYVFTYKSELSKILITHGCVLISALRLFYVIAMATLSFCLSIRPKQKLPLQKQ